MTRKRTSAELVLAVFSSTRGFGYAVFDGPKSLVDWGVKSAHCPQKNLESLLKIRELTAFYRPDVVVLEDYEGARPAAGEADTNPHQSDGRYAVEEGMSTAYFSRAAVRACFRLETKRQIADAITRRVPGTRAADATGPPNLDERRSPHEHFRRSLARNHVLSQQSWTKQAALTQPVVL